MTMIRGASFGAIDHWPGEPVAPYEERPYSPFSSTWTSTCGIVTRELGFLDASNVMILLPVEPSEVRVDRSGLKAGAEPQHPGVVLSFESGLHGPLKYACAKYDARRGGESWKENLRAIGLGLEALRRVERYGIATRGEQYTGWKALGAGVAMGSAQEYVNVEDAARTLMHLADGDPDSWEDAVTLVVDYYRDAAKLHHPDAGGDAALFAKAGTARDYIEAHIWKDDDASEEA